MKRHDLDRLLDKRGLDVIFCYKNIFGLAVRYFYKNYFI